MDMPTKCKYNPKFLCGVVKNPDNCPFVKEEHCNEANTVRWLGRFNQTWGTLTLQQFRFNVNRIKIEILEENQCEECRVIWADPKPTCPICYHGGDDDE